MLQRSIFNLFDAKGSPRAGFAALVRPNTGHRARPSARIKKKILFGAYQYSTGRITALK